MTGASGQLPGLRERNRIRTREDILEAASLLLGELGYNGTTLEAVAQKAGLSRKTIYAYFPSGRDHMVQDAYLRVSEQVERAGMSSRATRTEVVDRILALAEALIRSAMTPEGRFYAILGPDVVPALGSVMGGTSRSFTALIRSDLMEAVHAGRLGAETPIEDIAELLTGATRAAGTAAALHPDRSDGLLQALRMLVGGLLS